MFDRIPFIEAPKQRIDPHRANIISRRLRTGRATLTRWVRSALRQLRKLLFLLLEYLTARDGASWWNGAMKKARKRRYGRYAEPLCCIAPGGNHTAILVEP